VTSISGPRPSRASSAPDARRRHPLTPSGAAGLVLSAFALVGCGGSSRPRGPAAVLPPSYIPLTVGPGPAYRPPVANRRGPTTGAAGATCNDTLGPRFGVHIELFANRHVVLIPPGIGVTDSIQTGPSITAARCYSALVTLDPTGVVEIRPNTPAPTLADLFALWGQPLSSTRLAGFSGHPVHAFVNGRPVPGDPAAIRLRRHDEVALEIGGYVVPHQSYGFAHGL
jgi:hypothetical protein